MCIHVHFFKCCIVLIISPSNVHVCLRSCKNYALVTILFMRALFMVEAVLIPKFVCFFIRLVRSSFGFSGKLQLTVEFVEMLKCEG